MTRTAQIAPGRVQRQRTTGWRMPEGVVYVGRPTRWGNPFRVGEDYQIVLRDGSQRAGHVDDAARAVDLFAEYIEANPDLVPIVREHLAGRDLACWCPVGQPCHADVLLAVANGCGTDEPLREHLRRVIS